MFQRVLAFIAIDKARTNGEEIMKFICGAVDVITLHMPEPFDARK